MNKLEARYADQLELLKVTSEIVDWKFGAMKFRLGDGAHPTKRPPFYTPDFLVVYSDHFELHEIKGGFFREAAKVRIKTAAELYPWFVWKVVRWVNGGWEMEEM
jgi:hypothetical protein